MTTLNNNQRISPFFQLGALFISLLIIGTALYINVFTFHTRENYPPLKKITEEKKKQWNAHPTRVTVGLYIKQFLEFSIIHSTCVFSGTVWFLFDKKEVDLDKLGEFSFEQGDIIAKSKPYSKTIDGKELVEYNVKVNIHSALDHSHFPLDDHRLYFVLTHTIFEPKDIIFISSQNDFTINTTVKTSGWQMINRTVETGYINTKFDLKDKRKNRHYPAVAFSIDYARCARRYVVSILLPLLFLFFLGLFSFSVDNRASLALATAAITGTMGYRYVIEKLSPLSGYFMLSDYIFFIFLAAACIIFVLTIIDVYTSPLSMRQKKAAILALHGLIDLISIYFLVLWT